MTEPLHLRAPTVAAERLAPLTFAVLRLRRPAAPTLEDLAHVLGAPLPQAGRIAEGRAGMIAGLAPGEWCLVGGAWNRDDVIGAAARTCLASLVDLTHGHASWRISGSDAGALLSKGCTLDFHDRGFPAGRAMQSALAQTFITILRPTTAAEFIVIAERSYADHLEAWLRDAFIEFDCQDAGYASGSRR